MLNEEAAKMWIIGVRTGDSETLLGNFWDNSEVMLFHFYTLCFEIYLLRN